MIPLRIRTCIALAALLMGLVARAGAADPVDDVYEPNDTAGSAKDLPGYGVYELMALDEDWLRIRNVRAGTLYLDIDYAPGPTELNLFWWEANGATLRWANVENLAFHVTPVPGTTTVDFLIQVKPSNGLAPVPYTLRVLDAVDVTPDDAADAGAGDDNIGSAALVPAQVTIEGRGRDSDFFAVDVEPGVFTVTVPAATEVQDIQVYGADFQWRCSYEAFACRYEADGVKGVRTVLTDHAQRLYVSVVPSGAFTPGAKDVAYTLEVHAPARMARILDTGPARFTGVTLANLLGDAREEILIGTSKGLDGSDNELPGSPAGLLCLFGDGTPCWPGRLPVLLPPLSPDGGRTYTGSSVSSTPVVADLDGDGQRDVVMGVGGDIGGERQPDAPGQPGDLGGVCAIDGGDGDLLWCFQTGDDIGGNTNTGDGIPDGVASTPLVVELDGDPWPEVVFGGLDRRIWALDGESGAVRWQRLVHDTVVSSPIAADLDADGEPEILIGADITKNLGAGVQFSGGVFHVLRTNGAETVPGFDQEINEDPTNPAYEPIYGKHEEQVLWGMPAVADFDGDDRPEIAYGTAFSENVPDKGRFVRVWNHDGSPLFLFPTAGQTYAAPHFADLDGNGTLELIAADTAGYVYAWNRDGSTRFATLAVPWCAGEGASAVACAVGQRGITSAPLSVDLDADGRLEILVISGYQIVVLDADGVQQSDWRWPFLGLGAFVGTPAVGEVDGDGVLDIVTAGNLWSSALDKTTLFAWNWDGALAPLGRFGRRQVRQVPEPDPWLAALGVALVLGGLAHNRACR